MTTQTPKKLSVSSYQQDNKKPVPSLHLYGEWLQDHGFPIGTTVYMTCLQEQLTLQTVGRYKLSNELTEKVLDEMKRMGQQIADLKKRLEP